MASPRPRMRDSALRVRVHRILASLRYETCVSDALPKD